MEITPDVALAVLARWPLPRARLAGSLPGSARNVNLLVEDSDGSQYVLRCGRRNPGRDRVVFQLDFQEHLRRRGIPAAEVVATKSGDRAWLHADFHGRNLVISGGQVHGVFDFDVVHYGWRLADVGYALFCFSRQDQDSSVIRADAARAFVEPFGLTSLEREALPYFVVATHARTAPRYRVRQREGAGIAQVLRSHVARIRALSTGLGLTH